MVVQGPRGDGDRRTRRSRLDQLSRWDMSGRMKGMIAKRTDVVIKENSSAARMEVLEPSKVVNLTINDYPLKENVKFVTKSTEEALTRSPSLLCSVTASRVSFCSCLCVDMDIIEYSRGAEGERLIYMRNVITRTTSM